MDIKRIFVENGSMQSAGSGALPGEDTSQGGSPAGVFTDRNYSVALMSEWYNKRIKKN